jgi:hypothetical protein
MAVSDTLVRKRGDINIEDPAKSPEGLYTKLAKLEVGDHIYLEAYDAKNLQTRINSKQRWPASMAGWNFETVALTAVASVGRVWILVRAQRTA